MNIPLPIRIAFCILSGIGVGAIVATGIFVFDAAFFAVSGLLFAAGVLFPYLKWDKRFWLRAAALALASALSYYCAFLIAVRENWIAFTIASVVGAAIVLAAFMIAMPARISLRFVLFGLAAGLIGGPIMWFTLEASIPLPEPGETILGLAGYAIWHTNILLAIEFGTRTGGSRKINS